MNKLIIKWLNENLKRRVVLSLWRSAYRPSLFDGSRSCLFIHNYNPVVDHNKESHGMFLCPVPAQLVHLDYLNVSQACSTNCLLHKIHCSMFWWYKSKLPFGPFGWCLSTGKVLSIHIHWIIFLFVFIIRQNILGIVQWCKAFW